MKTIKNWRNKYHYRSKKDTKVVNPTDNPYVFESMFRGNPYIKEVSLHQNTIYIEEKHSKIAFHWKE